MRIAEEIVNCASVAAGQTLSRSARHLGARLTPCSASSEPAAKVVKQLAAVLAIIELLFAARVAIIISNSMHSDGHVRPAEKQKLWAAEQDGDEV